MKKRDLTMQIEGLNLCKEIGYYAGIEYFHLLIIRDLNRFESY